MAPKPAKVSDLPSHAQCFGLNRGLLGKIKGCEKWRDRKTIPLNYGCVKEMNMQLKYGEDEIRSQRWD